MDNTQTYARTCRQVFKTAKKQRKPNGWHKASIKTSCGVEKGVFQAHQHHGDVSYKWSHSTSHKRGGCNHASKWPKNQQAQTHGRHKAWQGLDVDKQTWR